MGASFKNGISSSVIFRYERTIVKGNSFTKIVPATTFLSGKREWTVYLQISVEYMPAGNTEIDLWILPTEMGDGRWQVAPHTPSPFIPTHIPNRSHAAQKGPARSRTYSG